MFWPFKRKQWEKLGHAYAEVALHDILTTLHPDNIITRDMDYRAIPQKDFEQLIFDSWFPKDEPAFKSEIFDCDDFAICFMAAIKIRWARVSKGKEALAFGYIFADVEGMGQHAFSWHMDDKGVFRFYEPQSGNRVDYKFNSLWLVES